MLQIYLSKLSLLHSTPLCAAPGPIRNRPCVKQYISQDSLPYLSASNTALSQSSLLRMDFVSKNVCWMPSASFGLQNIFKIFCSSAL